MQEITQQFVNEVASLPGVNAQFDYLMELSIHRMFSIPTNMNYLRSLGVHEIIKVDRESDVVLEISGSDVDGLAAKVRMVLIHRNCTCDLDDLSTIAKEENAIVPPDHIVQDYELVIRFIRATQAMIHKKVLTDLMDRVQIGAESYLNKTYRVNEGGEHFDGCNGHIKTYRLFVPTKVLVDRYPYKFHGFFADTDGDVIATTVDVEYMIPMDLDVDLSVFAEY